MSGVSFLQSFERTLGGMVEGTFGRLFRTEVRPMEIAHKLAREMDEHRTASVSRVYAPNEFLVWLSAEDRARYEPVEGELIDELCAYLLEHARREELTLASRPVVTFNTDEDLALGEFGIQARLVRLSADGRPITADGEPEALDEPEADAERGHTMIYGSASRLREQVAEAQPADQGAHLRVDGRRTALAASGAVIGRSRGCDITVEDPGISRRHAEIRRAPDGWEVRDLGSTNGVYLNGSQITGPVRLRAQDRIELGETEIIFEAS